MFVRSSPFMIMRYDESVQTTACAVDSAGKVEGISGFQFPKRVPVFVGVFTTGTGAPNRPFNLLFSIRSVVVLPPFKLRVRVISFLLYLICTTVELSSVIFFWTMGKFVKPA